MTDHVTTPTPPLGEISPTDGSGTVDQTLDESGRPWGKWQDFSVEIDAPALVG